MAAFLRTLATTTATAAVSALPFPISNPLQTSSQSRSSSSLNFKPPHLSSSFLHSPLLNNLPRPLFATTMDAPVSYQDVADLPELMVSFTLSIQLQVASILGFFVVINVEIFMCFL